MPEPLPAVGTYCSCAVSQERASCSVTCRMSQCVGVQAAPEAVGLPLLSPCRLVYPRHPACIQRINLGVLRGYATNREVGPSRPPSVRSFAVAYCPNLENASRSRRRTRDVADRNLLRGEVQFSTNVR